MKFLVAVAEGILIYVLLLVMTHALLTYGQPTYSGNWGNGITGLGIAIFGLLIPILSVVRGIMNQINEKAEIFPKQDKMILLILALSIIVVGIIILINRYRLF